MRHSNIQGSAIRVADESSSSFPLAIRKRGTLILLSALFAITGGAQASPPTVPFPPAIPLPTETMTVATVTPSQTPIDPVLQRVNEAVEITKRRNLDFQRHTPWQILHGLLALRENYTIKNGDQFVNALDFLSTQARYKGEAWFEVTPYGGRAHPYNGTPYDFEGHVNQTLAIIAMCNVPLSHKFVTGDGRSVTMADMVRNAQVSLNPREELTWTLWFLTHYLDQDTSWTTAQGQQWSMEALVRNQVSHSVLTAPCGGCHNLFALAYARNSYLQKHGQLRGAWLEADHKIQQYIATAQAMQNRDGSFATQYFKARGYSTDFNERIKSSGHMLEWLLVALPKSRLNESWIRSGVQTLANDMIQNAAQPADCGPLYHSLNALVLYQQRMKAFEQTEPVEQAVAKPDSTELESTPEANDGSPTPSAEPHILTTPKSTQMAPAPKSTPEAYSEFKLPYDTLPPGPASSQLPPVAENSRESQARRPRSSPAPALISPPQQKPETTPNRFRSRFSDQPRSLRRLSSEAESPKGSTIPTVQAMVEPSRLTPVPGGMPIFSPTSPEATTVSVSMSGVEDESSFTPDSASTPDSESDEQPQTDGAAEPKAAVEPAALPVNRAAKPAVPNSPSPAAGTEDIPVDDGKKSL